MQFGKVTRPSIAENIGLTHKQKIGVKKLLGANTWNWRGIPTILGGDFWGAWSPGETKPKNLQKNIAGEIRWQFF